LAPEFDGIAALKVGAQQVGPVSAGGQRAAPRSARRARPVEGRDHGARERLGRTAMTARSIR
jgi:hypothetical protein